MIYDLLATFLLSMTPVGELRAGIPYGLLHGLPSVLTFVTAFAGNMVPIFFLLWLLPHIDKILDKSLIGLESQNSAKTRLLSPLRCFYSWYKVRTHRKYSKKFERLGALALVIFVAIPLPITGAWTGSLAAHIFRIQFKSAIALIGAGVMIAGLAVSLITLGIL